MIHRGKEVGGEGTVHAMAIGKAPKKGPNASFSLLAVWDQSLLSAICSQPGSGALQGKL